MFVCLLYFFFFFYRFVCDVDIAATATTVVTVVVPICHMTRVYGSHSLCLSMMFAHTHNVLGYLSVLNWFYICTWHTHRRHCHSSCTPNSIVLLYIWRAANCLFCNPIRCILYPFAIGISREFWFENCFIELFIWLRSFGCIVMTKIDLKC